MSRGNTTTRIYETTDTAQDDELNFTLNAYQQTIHLKYGGVDTVDMGDGDDQVYLYNLRDAQDDVIGGVTLTADDAIDGGNGNDELIFADQVLITSSAFAQVQNFEKVTFMGTGSVVTLQNDDVLLDGATYATVGSGSVTLDYTQSTQQNLVIQASGAVDLKGNVRVQLASVDSVTGSTVRLNDTASNYDITGSTLGDRIDVHLDSFTEDSLKLDAGEGYDVLTLSGSYNSPQYKNLNNIQNFEEFHLHESVESLAISKNVLSQNDENEDHKLLLRLDGDQGSDALTLKLANLGRADGNLYLQGDRAVELVNHMDDDNDNIEIHLADFASQYDITGSAFGDKVYIHGDILDVNDKLDGQGGVDELIFVDSVSFGDLSQVSNFEKIYLEKSSVLYLNDADNTYKIFGSEENDDIYIAGDIIAYDDQISGGLGDDFLIFWNSVDLSLNDLENIQGFEFIGLESNNNSISVDNSFLHQNGDAAGRLNIIAQYGDLSLTLTDAQLATKDLYLQGSGSITLSAADNNDVEIHLSDAASNYNITGSSFDDKVYIHGNILDSSDKLDGQGGVDELIFKNQVNIAGSAFDGVKNFEKFTFHLSDAASQYDITGSAFGDKVYINGDILDSSDKLDGQGGVDELIFENAVTLSQDDLSQITNFEKIYLKQASELHLDDAMNPYDITGSASNDKVHIHDDILDSTDKLDGQGGDDLLTFWNSVDLSLNDLENIQGFEFIGLESNNNSISVNNSFLDQNGDAAGRSNIISWEDDLTLTLTDTQSATNDLYLWGSGSITLSSADDNDVEIHLADNNSQYNITASDYNDKIHIHGDILDNSDKIVGGLGHDVLIFEDSVDFSFQDLTGFENLEDLSASDPSESWVENHLSFSGFEELRFIKSSRAYIFDTSDLFNRSDLDRVVGSDYNDTFYFIGSDYGDVTFTGGNGNDTITLKSQAVFGNENIDVISGFEEIIFEQSSVFNLHNSSFSSSFYSNNTLDVNIVIHNKDALKENKFHDVSHLSLNFDQNDFNEIDFSTVNGNSLIKFSKKESILNISSLEDFNKNLYYLALGGSDLTIDYSQVTSTATEAISLKAFGNIYLKGNLRVQLLSDDQESISYFSSDSNQIHLKDLDSLYHITGSESDDVIYLHQGIFNNSNKFYGGDGNDKLVFLGEEILSQDDLSIASGFEIIEFKNDVRLSLNESSGYNFRGGVGNEVIKIEDFSVLTSGDQFENIDEVTLSFQDNIFDQNHFSNISSGKVSFTQLNSHFTVNSLSDFNTVLTYYAENDASVMIDFSGLTSDQQSHSTYLKSSGQVYLKGDLQVNLGFTSSNEGSEVHLSDSESNYSIIGSSLNDVIHIHGEILSNIDQIKGRLASQQSQDTNQIIFEDAIDIEIPDLFVVEGFNEFHFKQEGSSLALNDNVIDRNKLNDSMLIRHDGDFNSSSYLDLILYGRYRGSSDDISTDHAYVNIYLEGNGKIHLTSHDAIGQSRTARTTIHLEDSNSQYHLTGSDNDDSVHLHGGVFSDDDHFNGQDGFDELIIRNQSETLVDDGSITFTATTLDMTALSQDAVQNIERIDIRGLADAVISLDQAGATVKSTADNTLKLTADDILDMTDENNELSVLFDAGDIVEFHYTQADGTSAFVNLHEQNLTERTDFDGHVFYEHVLRVDNALNVVTLNDVALTYA